MGPSRHSAAIGGWCAAAVAARSGGASHSREIASMLRKTKLTFQDALKHMRTGHPLQEMHNSPPRKGQSWFVIPIGEVADVDARKLLERPDVQPAFDGLFPGVSQTYRIIPRDQMRRHRSSGSL
jgi:hypothetical protein